MKIVQTNNSISEVSDITITGIHKDKRTELLLTRFVLEYYGWEIYKRTTHNNWKNGALILRYAKNEAGFEHVKEGIKNDRQLPKTHPERSLLDEEDIVWATR